MIVEINKDTLARVNNLYLLFHILPGLMMAEDFKQYIKRTGIYLDETLYEKELKEKASVLKRKGAHFRNLEKSVHINRISPACLLCNTGEGAITVDISHACNRNCYHCFGDMSKIPKGQLYDYLSVLEAFGDLHPIQSMGLSGGEPLLFVGHAINCLSYVDERYPNAYKRLYTNGDFVDREVLRELQGVHLDEIRFSIKHTDFGDWKALRRKMTLAKEFIPNVMVEMPVMPGTAEAMRAILVALDEIEIFGINLCEFCYCMHHAEEFNKRSYRAKFPPFKMLYLGRNQYPGIPVAGSDLESYDLLEFALERGLKLGVHYCSLENRLTSPIYEMNQGRIDNPIDCFSQRDFFIKSAIACGSEDMARTIETLEAQGVREYRIVEGPASFVEFHVNHIPLLKAFDMELGIVSSVIEPEENAPVQGHGRGREVRRRKRVVRIDLAYPKSFDRDADV